MFLILINLNLNNLFIQKTYAINKDFLSKKGYFYIQISGNGKITKRRIEVTISSADRTKEQTVQFSDSAVNGSANNHNFKLLTTSATTKKANQYYVIFVLKFSYTKPAHYIAKGTKMDNLEDYRFNFNKYTTDGSIVNTVNSAGHNAVNKTETVEMQVNAANCGFVPVEDNVTPVNATGIINLGKDYYSGLTVDPNGGTHGGKTKKYNYGVKVCETQATIATPTRKGYVFLGWTLTKGKNCKSATFDNKTGKFTYCGASTSSSSPGNDNTCLLKAEWIKNDSTLILPETGGMDLKYLYYIAGAIEIICFKQKLKKI